VEEFYRVVGIAAMSRKGRENSEADLKGRYFLPRLTLA
jgi:hypothetical protein